MKMKESRPRTFTEEFKLKGERGGLIYTVFLGILN